MMLSLDVYQWALPIGQSTRDTVQRVVSYPVHSILVRCLAIPRNCCANGKDASRFLYAFLYKTPRQNSRLSRSAVLCHTDII